MFNVPLLNDKLDTKELEVSGIEVERVSKFMTFFDVKKLIKVMENKIIGMV